MWRSISDHGGSHSFSNLLVGCSVAPLAGKLWLFPVLHKKVSSPADHKLQAIEWCFKTCHVLRFSTWTSIVLHFKMAGLSVNTGKVYTLLDWIQQSSAGPEVSERCHVGKRNSWPLTAVCAEGENLHLCEREDCFWSLTQWGSKTLLGKQLRTGH